MHFFRIKERMIDPTDLCDRAFRMKLKLLLKRSKEDEPFSKLAAFVSVIELQKRGLVHAHMLLF